MPFRRIPPRRSLLLQVMVGIVGSIVCFIIFYQLAQEVLSSPVYELDVQLSQAVYQIRTPWLTAIMRGVSWFGGDKVLVIFVAAVIIFLWRKYKEDALLFAALTGIGFGLGIILKFIFSRPRPEIAPVYTEWLSSFPSLHAMNSTIIYITATYFFFRFTRKKKESIVLGCLSAGLILLIGFSRVYLGVHYPSDVIAGFVIGIWWIITVLLVEKIIELIMRERVL